MEKLYDFSHFLMDIWPFDVIPIIRTLEQDVKPI